MKRVLVLLAEGFEEIETVLPVDLWRRAGLEVVLASLTSEKNVRGGHEIVLSADTVWDGTDDRSFDALFLPGGGEGVDRLMSDSRVAPLAAQMAERGAVVAAICAAPMVLAAAGLLRGRRATSYPSTRPKVELDGVIYLEENVVIDGKLLTGRGPGTAAPFAFALLDLLDCSAAGQAVRQGALFL